MCIRSEGAQCITSETLDYVFSPQMELNWGGYLQTILGEEVELRNFVIEENTTYLPQDNKAITSTGSKAFLTKINSHLFGE